MTRSSASKSARERLREQQAREQAAATRRKSLMQAGVVLGVVVVIVAVFGLVQWQRSRVDSVAAYPAGASGIGEGVAFGQADAPVKVEMFEDFLCPHCKEFEDDAEPVLQEYLDSGQVQMVFYPVTLGSFGRPSELAANAFACAAEEGKGEEYRRALYQNFGQEWTNPMLIELGQQFDLGASFRACVNKDSYSEYVRSIDHTFTERGGTGTPTIMVDGEPLPQGDTTGAALRIAIEAALEGKK